MTSTLSKLMRTAVAVLVVALDPLVPSPSDAPIYQPRIESIAPGKGAPGEPVTVVFPPDQAHALTLCGAKFVWADSPENPVGVPCGGTDDYSIHLNVPVLRPPQPIELRWTATLLKIEPPEISGSVGFDVVAPPFDVRADRSDGRPTDPVIVTFGSPMKNVHITGCAAGFADVWSDCPKGELTARPVVPATAVPTLDWRLTYTIDQPGFAADPWNATGEIPFRVILPPPPKPVFDVVANPSLVGSGEPLTVEFTSRTAGIDIDSCAVDLDGPVACGESGTAVVRVPANARPGSTISIPWRLSYSGDAKGVADGEVRIQVERPAEPCFTAAVEPGAAAAGTPVTVTFTSLCGGFAIVDCLVFFPNDAGGQCQRSPERWLARTTVPLGAQPGMTVLRWGVESRTDDGRLAADNSGIAYRVLGSATSGPSTTGEPTREPPPVIGAGSPPRFVAMIDPESAAPGEPVTVTVSPIQTGVQITGCTVAFARSAESSCRHTAAGWAATVDVPSDADPGVLPLNWNADSPAGDDGGTVSYRVLGSGEPPPAAFRVLPEPGSVAAGDTVTVSWESLVDGVAITDCGAGFSVREMTSCRPSDHGWAAELTVPKTMPAGLGTLTWRLAYSRAGSIAENNTDGLLTLTVVDEPGWTWRDILRAAGELLLGGLALAALLGWRKIADRFRGRRPATEENTENPDGVRVVARSGADRMDLSTPDRYAPARHGIRIVPHPGAPPDIRITEEVP